MDSQTGKLTSDHRRGSSSPVRDFARTLVRPPVGTVLRWSLAILVAFAVPAWAVVPGLAGPLQALMQLLPQILPFMAAGLAGLMSSQVWRARLARFGRWAATPRGALSTCAVLGLLLWAVYLNGVQDRSLAVTLPPPAGTTGAKSSSWSMFRANLLRTGAAPGDSGPAVPNIRWTYRDSDARVADFSSSPAVVGGRVYAGSAQASVFDSSGMVYCLDAVSGKRIWQFQTEKQVFSSPSVAGGRVYVGEGLHLDTHCRLYCLDAATGKKLWAAPTRSHTESSPAVSGGRVFTGAGEDGVYCFDAASGRQLWHRTGLHVDTCPAVDKGRVLTGTGYGRLMALALDTNTGKSHWSTPCDLPVWGPPAVAGGRVYFGIGNGDFNKSSPAPKGGIWCLDAATGKQLWRRNLPDAVMTAISVMGGRLLAGCRDGRVYCVDATTGNSLWSTHCGGPVVASPAVDGSRVYAAAGGKVQALALADGKRVWSLDLIPYTSPDVELFSSPALADGRLYLGTGREKLFCIGR